MGRMTGLLGDKKQGKVDGYGRRCMNGYREFSTTPARMNFTV